MGTIKAAVVFLLALGSSINPFELNNPQLLKNLEWKRGLKVKIIDFPLV